VTNPETIIEKVPEPRYLGDGVYAVFDGFQIWVKTQREIHSTESVALEPNVFAELLAYAESVWHIKITVTKEPTE